MSDSAKRAGEGDSTYLDTEIRVKFAEDLLCKVHSTTEIVQKIVAEFHVVERTAYTYIKLAYDRLAGDTDFDRGIRKAQARATWRAQYRLCISKEAWQAANYALDRLCRLDGLFAPDKLEIVASLSIDVQIRSLVGVLDEKGLAALSVLQEQIEAGRKRGLLGNVPAAAGEDDVPLPDVPVPIPAQRRGRKADRSGTRKPRKPTSAED